MIKEVDLVIILKSGIKVKEQLLQMQSRFKDERIESRIIYYFPFNAEEFDYREEEKLRYYAFQNDQFYDNDKFWEGDKNSSKQDYKENSILRLSANPRKENHLILCDNYYSSGTTMKNSYNEFVGFGYHPENIFGFSAEGERTGFLNNEIFTNELEPSKNYRIYLYEIISKINN